MKKDEFAIRKKNTVKVIRSILEALIIILLVILVIRSIFTFSTYEPYNATKVSMATEKSEGFISISYFGVDRTQDETLISTQRLEKHLDALYHSGYVTITQQDVLDYYKKNKLLPKKSLFLMFEDGRRDTAIFAEKIMEKYNFKATMMTYGDKFEDNDPKFLSFDDLDELKASSYWEFGTNGYRLSFINVFDRYHTFLDCLNSKEFQIVQPYLWRDYDHYLMDFIRDENDVPKETLNELKQRINTDYQKMLNVYKEGMGSLPSLYVLMHSNTGRFGSSEQASAINGDNIYKMFAMNFNREGSTFNNRKNSIYDLTRMQPQANWYTNHVLMRVWDDTKEKVAFVSGDMTRKAYFDTLKGETEFDEDTIILTSLPDTFGLAKLKDSKDFKNFNLEVNLKGNECGGQSVLLRGDDKLSQYISVSIQDKYFYVKEKLKSGKAEKILYKIAVDDIEKKDKVSKEEDKKEADLAALRKDVKYAKDIESGRKAAIAIQEKEAKQAKTVSEGAVEYVPPVSTIAVGNYTLAITLREKSLSVTVDGNPAVTNLKVDITNAGYVFLKADVSKDGFSQRNLADDVYDGVFDQLYIETIPGFADQDPVVLYDNRLHGFEKFTDVCKNTWESLVDWFIRTL